MVYGFRTLLTLNLNLKPYTITINQPEYAYLFMKFIFYDPDNFRIVDPYCGIRDPTPLDTVFSLCRLFTCRWFLIVSDWIYFFLYCADRNRVSWRAGTFRKRSEFNPRQRTSFYQSAHGCRENGHQNPKLYHERGPR